MPLALVTVALAQLLDLTTFVLMVDRHTVAAEANPLVASLFETVGLPGLLVGKTLVVLLVGSLALFVLARGLRGRWALVAAVPIGLAIMAGLVGGYTNALAYLG
jgi:hypothetical protein